MHHTLTMCVGQRVRELAHQARHIGKWKRTLTRQPRAKRFALDVWHHVVQQPVGFARVVDSEHVRVREPRRRPDLQQKPLGSCMRDPTFKNFNSDLPVVTDIAGQIDSGHSSAPELALDGVASRQSDAQCVGEQGRGKHQRRGI